MNKQLSVLSLALLGCIENAEFDGGASDVSTTPYSRLVFKGGLPIDSAVIGTVEEGRKIFGQTNRAGLPDSTEADFMQAYLGGTHIQIKDKLCRFQITYPTPETMDVNAVGSECDSLSALGISYEGTYLEFLAGTVSSFRRADGGAFATLRWQSTFENRFATIGLADGREFSAKLQGSPTPSAVTFDGCELSMSMDGDNLTLASDDGCGEDLVGDFVECDVKGPGQCEPF